MPVTGGAARVRVELRLAGPASRPLGDPGLDPDPLQGIAAALGRLHGQHDGAIVAVDLLPKTAAQARRFRSGLLKRAAQDAGLQTPGAFAGLSDRQQRGAGRLPAQTVDRLLATRALQRKLDASDPLFTVQILLCAQAPRARVRAIG